MPRNTTTTSSHNIHSNNTNSSSNSYNTINIYQGYHRERALFATFPTVTDFRLLQHARTRCTLLSCMIHGARHHQAQYLRNRKYTRHQPTSSIRPKDGPFLMYRRHPAAAVRGRAYRRHLQAPSPRTRCRKYKRYRQAPSRTRPRYRAHAHHRRASLAHF